MSVNNRQQNHNKRRQEPTGSESDDASLTSTSSIDILENSESSKRVVYCRCVFFMVFSCEACGSSFKYNSDRGLRQHQLNCEEFLLADNEASTVDDALDKYRRKLQRKKHKAVSEVSLTGSGVR
jgi:hypothetical protein